MPIESTDIQLRRAGSAGLGGAIAASAIQGFGEVSETESTAGVVKYRCFYVRNGHATDTLSAAKLWLSANTLSPATVVAIGLGTSAVNGTEQTVANETTAPAGVTFGAAANEAAAIALGNLAAGQSRAVWLRLTVTAGAAGQSSDAYELTFAGEAPDEQTTPVAATVQNVWTGVPKTDGAVISAKMNSANSASASRVAISRTANLASPTYSPVVAPDATYRVAKHDLSGLLPDTEYFYGIEVDGTLDTTTTGRFKTLPAAGPASFSIVLGGCSENTNDAAFAALNALDPKPLFLLAQGDFQYMDIAAPTIAQYHVAFDTTLARTVRKATHSQIPTVYTWDDHDFGTDNSTGRDNSNGVRSFRATGLQFFRDRIPAITASSTVTDTAHYSFVVGRLRFIMSDMRSDKTGQGATDNASKTMMGAAQKAWFKGQIDAAKAAGQAVAWINSVPWVVAATAGADDWSGYTTERTELSDYIKAQGMQGKVFILSSDMHALAIHAGADYATGGGAAIPVFHAGPFNRRSSNKGGPYTYGPYPVAGATPAVQQYGTMTVTDDGTTLAVTWKGYTSDGVERMSHTFNALAPAPAATAPAQMAAPTASVGNGQSAVALVAPADGGSPITGYTVVSSPAGGVDAAAGTLALERTITGLQNGTAYTFSARATNAIGNSPASPASNQVTPVAPPQSGFAATGGQITEPGDGYRYWTFLEDSTLNVTTGGEVEVLLVGGGGAGASGGATCGGGGGAGEPKTANVTIPAGAHAVTIGKAGVGVTGSATTPTAATGSSIGAIVSADPGGYGAVPGAAGGNGASGGGASGGGASNFPPGSGTAGKGNTGGTGASNATNASRAAGGGGGAGGPGANAASGVGGDGGPGVTVWGRSLAGGGGGASQGSTQGQGKDGGGNASKTAAAGSAAANTGAGGAGASGNFRSGDGGTGIVIIRRAI